MPIRCIRWFTAMSISLAVVGWALVVSGQQAAPAGAPQRPKEPNATVATEPRATSDAERKPRFLAANAGARDVRAKRVA